MTFLPLNLETKHSSEMAASFLPDPSLRRRRWGRSWGIRVGPASRRAVGALSPLDMTLELATCFLDLPRSLGFAGERPTAACGDRPARRRKMQLLRQVAAGFPIVTHTLESATRLFDLLRALGDKEELSLA